MPVITFVASMLVGFLLMFYGSYVAVYGMEHYLYPLIDSKFHLTVAHLVGLRYSMFFLSGYKLTDLKVAMEDDNISWVLHGVQFVAVSVIWLWLYILINF